MKFGTASPQKRQQPLVLSMQEQREEAQGMGMRLGRQVQRQQSVDEFASNTSETDLKHRPVVRQTPKVGRNDPCPCGSGKKYKKCCGR
jgi:uncharacterized protein YecA (UPF0149 family)